MSNAMFDFQKGENNHPGEEMGYLWSGRFRREFSASARQFSCSLDLDARLGIFDVAGSLAHVRMLRRQGIISRRDAELLLSGLRQIEKEILAGRFQWKKEDEDIHTAIERRLTEIAGKTGEKLHTGRSRNDQVVLDEKLFLKKIIPEIMVLIRKLQIVLLNLAEKNFSLIMPAYTHLQPAQPVLLSHYFLAYMEMLDRDYNRFREAMTRLDELPLGVAAGTGTTLPLDRRQVARELGFSKISRNSLDTVSDRDFIAEVLFDSALVMVHLSRMAEDLILWATREFNFTQLPEQFCTGSSIMPQKKNPDILELIRGRSSVVISGVSGILSLMKGLPLSYNRDLQEDKRFLFPAVEVTVDCLKILALFLPCVGFNKERMEKAAEEGFILATELAEYLTGKGLPFRQAHQISGRIVRYCLSKGKDLKSLTLSEYRYFSPLFQKDIYHRLKAKTAVSLRKTIGGTSPANVRRELKRWKKILK